MNTKYGDAQQKYYKNIQGPRLKEARRCTPEVKQQVTVLLKEYVGPKLGEDWIERLVEYKVRTWTDFIRVIERMMYYRDLPREVGRELCDLLERGRTAALEKVGLKPVRDALLQEQLDAIKSEDMVILHPPQRERKDTWISLPPDWAD